MAFCRSRIADATADIQKIGLEPLYEVLFAASNCPSLVIDDQAFDRVARLYRLSPGDFVPGGPFAERLAALATEFRVRLEDDRMAFCDARRLRFAVPQGVLIERDR